MSEKKNILLKKQSFYLLSINLTKYRCHNLAIPTRHLYNLWARKYSAYKTIFLSFINLTKYRCHNLAIPKNFPSRRSDRKMLEKLKTYPFTKKCLWSAIVYPGRAVAHRDLGLRAAENVGTVAGGFWPRWFWSHGCTDDRPSEKLIWPCLLLSRKFTVTHTHTQKPQSAFSK